jgi:RNA polymerase sigma-70 factor (ECF subfamily)
MVITAVQPRLSTTTAGSLAEAARAGDGEAVAELFRRVAPRARRAAAAYCSRSDVDDAVAEGFARALARLSQLRQPGSVESWIVRCAVRAAADLSRRHARQELGGSAVDLEARIRPAQPSAADGALLALDRVAVARALAGLADAHRQILWLRFHAGLSVQEAAQRLCLPEGTARRRCFEAAQHLAERYLSEQLRPAEGECARATALMCRSIRRTLGPIMAKRLDVHLRRCPACRARRKALDELLGTSG